MEIPDRKGAPVELTIEQLLDSEGQELAPSPWREVDQTLIDGFAELTGDHQWIHVDRARAAGSPFGTTIAHGYLTVSLIPVLLAESLQVVSPMGVNYGIDRLRFTAPVPSGSAIRLQGSIREVEDRGSAVSYRMDVRLEVRGSDRPAAVATITYLAYR